MAQDQELFYRPDIRPPEREFIQPEGEGIPLLSAAEAAAAGIPPEDIPKDPFSVMKLRFKNLKEIGEKLTARARFLLDLSIQDIDGYVGSAPHYILQCIEDLTGVKFSSATGPTDPIYTLEPDVLKCIFRIAGYHDPKQGKPKIDPNNLNSDAFKEQINNILKDKSYMEAVSYGFKLLLIVVKICFVIIVHYTVGYVCGWLKGKLKILGIQLGTMIANKVFAPVEKFLIGLVGYKCSERSQDEPDCDDPAVWEQADLKRVTCCTTKPFFFQEGPNGTIQFHFGSCFERWVRDEMFPSSAGRVICSTLHANDTKIEPTVEEAAKAKVVSDYLMEQPSRYGVMDRSDIPALRSAIDSSEFSVTMADQVQSSLDSGQYYKKNTSSDKSSGNCFGYIAPDFDYDLVSKQSGDANWAVIENGGYFFEYLQQLDELLTAALSYSDKIVTGTASLSKWGSSRQICCYVYLMVIMSSLVHSLITKGNICSNLTADGGFADDLRHELKWASSIKSNADVKKFVNILRVIKSVIDAFIRKMERSVLLAGMRLPLSEMFQDIKMVVGNALAQYLDYLFGPIDQVLSGVQGIPEVRHLINNECFGFDKLANFLSCSLGSLKWGILDEIMKIFDKFSMNDLSLIDDIYLSRARLSFLKSLSRLLGNLANLILGLGDCYDPTTLVNEVVGNQVKDQYNETWKLVELAGNKNNVAFIDECSKSLMGTTLIPDPERVDELESDPSNLSSAFGELGAVSQRIISRELLGSVPVMISEFINKDGELVESGEFIKRMEQITGIKTVEITESMNYIFDILRGGTDNV